ncbi:MAG: histidine kinase, partial [Verrucomicrobiia bacterium]
MTRVLYLTQSKERAEKAGAVLSRQAEVTIDCASTLEELLAMLSSDQGSAGRVLVLIDFDSPDLAGPNLVGTVKLCFPDVPVLAAIRNEELSSIAEASRTGALGFVMVGDGYWADLPAAFEEFMRRCKLEQPRFEEANASEHCASLLNELKAACARSKALSQQLVKLREEESARIARELHDQLGQALTGLKLDVAWMQRRLARLPENPVTAGMQSRLKLMEESIDGTIAITRKICSELRPGVLDDLGLVAAIDWQANEFKKRASVDILLLLPERELAVAPATATAVFRIFQEIL